jgi:RNA polymerase sigma-70 factor (ECF subfamily)
MSATFTENELEAVLPSLRRFAYSLTKSDDRAADLVQDSVERAILKAHYFEPGTNLRSWMFTVCRRIFLNQIRKQKTRGVSVEMEDAPQAKLAENASQEVSMACSEMQAAFALLSTRDQLVLSLIVLEGRKYEEAAEILEVPVGTVRSRLSRARSKLRELVEAGAARDAQLAV